MRRMAVPRKQILSGTCRLSYLEAGSGRPMILLHAFPLNAEMWNPQLAAPSPGWRVIAPDLRGFGPDGSAPEEAPAESMNDYADDVLRLMDGLGITRAVVGGLSMGAYIVFALLRRASERLSGLVLADTRSGPDTDQGRAARRAMQALAEREGSAGVAREMLPKLLSETTRRERQVVVRRVRELIEATTPVGIRTALECMMWRPDSTGDLLTLRLPTAMLVGAEDVLTPVRESERMRELVPDARLTVIPHAGHLSNLERPDEFNEAIAAFVADV